MSVKTERTGFPCIFDGTSKAREHRKDWYPTRQRQGARGRSSEAGRVERVGRLTWDTPNPPSVQHTSPPSPLPPSSSSEPRSIFLSRKTSSPAPSSSTVRWRRVGDGKRWVEEWEGENGKEKKRASGGIRSALERGLCEGGRRASAPCELEGAGGENSDRVRFRASGLLRWTRTRKKEKSEGGERGQTCPSPSPRGAQALTALSAET